MTLFIAVVLLYHFDMGWGWYAAACAIYLGHCFTNPVFLSFFDIPMK